MATATDAVTFPTETLVSLALDTNAGTYTITNSTSRKDLKIRFVGAADWQLSTVPGGAGAYVIVEAKKPIDLPLGSGPLVVYAKVASSTSTLYAQALP